MFQGTINAGIALPFKSLHYRCSYFHSSIWSDRLFRANTANLQRSVLGGGASCSVHILFACLSLGSKAAFEPFAIIPQLDFIQHQCQLLPWSNLQLGTPPSQRKEVDLPPPFQPKRPLTSHCLPALFLKLVVIIKISELYPCCRVRAQEMERRWWLQSYAKLKKETLDVYSIQGKRMKRGNWMLQLS